MSTETPLPNTVMVGGVNNLPPRLIEEWDNHVNRVKKNTGKWLTLTDQNTFIQDWIEAEAARKLPTPFVTDGQMPNWYLPLSERTATELTATIDTHQASHVRHAADVEGVGVVYDVGRHDVFELSDPGMKTLEYAAIAVVQDNPYEICLIFQNYYSTGLSRTDYSPPPPSHRRATRQPHRHPPTAANRKPAPSGP
eukprot:4968713-Prymnesium_polylepis.1